MFKPYVENKHASLRGPSISKFYFSLQLKTKHLIVQMKLYINSKK